MKNHTLIITALETELPRRLLPVDMAIVYTGVGKVNASIATVKAIQQYEPNRVINFGTVGRINPAVHGLIEIGRVVQRYMMAEPLAPRGQVPFCMKPQEYLAQGKGYTCGTGDSFVTAEDLWLHNHQVDVVDMELFAIAAVAYDFNIPWQSFKYITDDANNDSGDDWQAKVGLGADLFIQSLVQSYS